MYLIQPVTQSVYKCTMTCFGTYLYSIGIHPGNLLKLLQLVTMSRVTYRKLHSKKKRRRKKKESRFEKMKMNGLGSRDYLRRGRNSWQWTKHAQLNSDLLQALKGEHLSALGSQQRGLYFLHLQYPQWVFIKT